MTPWMASVTLLLALARDAVDGRAGILRDGDWVMVTAAGGLTSGLKASRSFSAGSPPVGP